MGGTMQLDQLFEKAFALKKMNAWDVLDTAQVFAVRACGQICLMHLVNEEDGQRAIVYPQGAGTDNFLRFLAVLGRNPTEMNISGKAMHTLQCSFGPKEMLDREEQEQVRAYTRAQGINLRGKNAWPQFERVDPYRMGVSLTEEADVELLSEALDAAAWVIGQIRDRKISISDMYRDTRKLVCAQRVGGLWQEGSVTLQEPAPIVYPKGICNNDMYRARVRKLPRQGTWASRLIVGSTPSAAENYEGMVYPWRLLTVDVKTKRAIQIQGVRDYETRTDVMLDKLMEAMFRENVCPRTITVSDDRTKALLEDWCGEMNIQLKQEDPPEVLDEMETHEMTEAGEVGSSEEVSMVFDLLLMLPDEMLLSNPHTKELLPVIREMRKDPRVPAEILQKLDRMEARLNSLAPQLGTEGSPGEEGTAGKKGTAGKGGKSRTLLKKPASPEKSLVISVSLGTGCYRHLQISTHATLEDLSDAILDAFDFMDDHAHGFFMDNRAYSPRNCYYARGFDPSCPSTDTVRLESLNLQPEAKFKYIFDFGDDWEFQCRVLKELEEITKTPMIVRSKGEAPEQYPDWDEEDDWDDEDDEDDEDGWDDE